jgi:hypothetical protein
MWPLAADGALQLTEDAAGATWQAGILRRPSDAAVVATQVPPPGQSLGFPRAANGAIAYAPADPAVVERHNGFGLTADGRIATTQTDPAPAFLQHGLKFDAARRVYAVVLP